MFPESKILHWFVQIALGLHYMHGRLVLHRDLKTQNIFLLGNGRLVLGDLGISKVCTSKCCRVIEALPYVDKKTPTGGCELYCKKNNEWRGYILYIVVGAVQI